MTMQNKAGYVLCAAMAFMCAAAWGGENLIVNGDFESSTGIGSGAVTQVRDGASIAPWKALRATNVGVVRAASAENWRLTGAPKNACGTFAIYMQPSSDAGDVSIYQDVTVPEPGFYKFSGKFKIPCLCSLLYPCIPQIVINEICIIQIRSGIERIMRFENLTDIWFLISYDRSGKQHSTCLSPDHTGSYHMIPYGKIILRRKVLLYHLTHLIISCHHDLAHLGAFVCYIHSAFPKQFDPVEISVP